ncbi:MAG: hypothetical protein ACI9G1_001920 [Pirellulaceae bacterium]|jgi:hypothetical protein
MTEIATIKLWEERAGLAESGSLSDLEKSLGELTAKRCRISNVAAARGSTDAGRFRAGHCHHDAVATHKLTMNELKPNTRG